MNVFFETHLSLRQWIANCESLQEELKLTGVATVDQERVKTLGVFWDALSDLLSLQGKFKYNEERSVKCNS